MRGERGGERRGEERRGRGERREENRRIRWGMERSCITVYSTPDNVARCGCFWQPSW